MKEHKFPEPDAGVLFPYGEGQDAATVRWLNSQDLRDTFGLRQQISVDAHRRWIDSASNILIWGIRAPDGEHAGNVLLTITERHRSAYFQIYIGEQSARGKGLGQAALSATLKMAFAHYGVHRVWLHTLVGNHAAEKLYQKNGFVMEGVERDALWSGAGYSSQKRWSLLEPEWRLAQPRPAGPP